MKKIVAFLTILILAADLAAASSTAIKKKGRADLTVSALRVSKKMPLRGKTRVRVKYSIKNRGDIASPASLTRIQLSGQEIRSLEQKTPPLKPGETFTTTIDYDLAREGNYLIRVSADYNNIIPENDEMNNDNNIRLSIGRKL